MPDQPLRLATLPNAASRKWNPMTWMLNQGLERIGFSIHDLTREALMEEQFDLLHVHFFEGYTYFRNPFKIILRCRKLLRGIDRQKKLGAKLVYTAHDVIGHDTPWRSLEDWFFRQFMRRVDGTIFVSDVSIPLVRKRFPELTGASTTIPLSDYGDWYKNEVTAAQAREKFGVPVDALVITHVGLIKRYKNVPALIEAFSQLDGNYALLIGGRVLEEELKQELLALAAKDSRVKLRLEHLDDDDMQDYMNAADVVVLPYRAILNSGSAMLALTFGRPVIVPNVGSLPELQANLSSDWVQLYDGEFGVNELRAGLDWVKATTRAEKAPLEKLTVEAIAQQHSDFYRSLKG